LTTSDPKILRKLDRIIGEMLANNSPPFVRFHYNRLLTESGDEDFVRVQMVMALVTEIAENQTEELNEKRFESLLQQLPVDALSSFA